VVIWELMPNMSLGTLCSTVGMRGQGCDPRPPWLRGCPTQAGDADPRVGHAVEDVVGRRSTHLYRLDGGREHNVRHDPGPFFAQLGPVLAGWQ